MKFIFFLSIVLITSEQQINCTLEHSLFKYDFEVSENDVISSFRGFNRIINFFNLTNDKKYATYFYEQTIVIENTDSHNIIQYCEIVEVYQEQTARAILQFLENLLKLNAKKITMDMMTKLMNNCDALDDNNKNIIKIKEKFGNELDENSEVLRNNEDRHVIFPGTKWCGFGDIADNYHDLGKLRTVDRCCRTHDLCPIKILSRDKRYELKNSAVYTKSHCICDEAFYDCLKKNNHWSAKILGMIYFNIAKPECIKGVPELHEEEMKFVRRTRKW